MNDSGRERDGRVNIDVSVRRVRSGHAILDRMTAKGKTFLIVQQVSETTIVTAGRPLFRKVYCPSCGRETGVFERDGDARANAHVILCPEHSGGGKDEETGN